MSLDGLETADANSVQVAVDDATVRVASLPSLVALKLFAHRDRAAREPKDLLDLVYMLEHATDALQSKVFQELGGELVELEYDEAGPYLLGRELAAITSPSERETLVSIIDERILVPPRYAALVRVMRATDLEDVVRRFRALRRGMSGSKTSTQTHPGSS